MNQTVIKDLLYNLREGSGASEQYCRGLVVGAVAVLFAMGFVWEEVTATIRENLPDEYREECIPEGWRGEIL